MELRNALESHVHDELEFFWTSKRPEIVPYQTVARMLLSLSATSSESESVFSTAGFLQRDRESISEEVLNMQLVINRSAPKKPDEIKSYLTGMIDFIREKKRSSDYLPESIQMIADDLLPEELLDS